MKPIRWRALPWVFCLQYFLAEGLAIHGWRGSYSLRQNFISDLGAVTCGPSGRDTAICSPLHLLMNASFLLQGILILSGTAFVWSLFPRAHLWSPALGLIAASGVGVFVVGLAPEDVSPGRHYLGATENFLFCNMGAALLGLALFSERPALRPVGLISLLAGVVGLAGLVCLATQSDFGLGIGALERVTAYPFPLWIAGMGGWLARGGDPRALRAHCPRT